MHSQMHLSLRFTNSKTVGVRTVVVEQKIFILIQAIAHLIFSESFWNTLYIIRSVVQWFNSTQGFNSYSNQLTPFSTSNRVICHAKAYQTNLTNLIRSESV